MNKTCTTTFPYRSFLPALPKPVLGDRRRRRAAMICFMLLALAGVRTAFAQQEPQFTQFMFNKMSFNPGYAGSFISPTLTAIYRNQWMGIDGAPNTQILSFSQPAFGERVGLGVSLSRTSISINRIMTVDLVWSYRIPMRRGHLGIGVMPSVRNIWQNWTDERIYSPTPAGTDVAIPTEDKSKWVVNFGAGFYYSNDEKGWYMGVALPRFFKQNIDFAENGGILSREEWHFNAMGGLTLQPNEDLKIIPQLLLKFVPNAPFDAEVNVGAMLREKFYGGLSYRAGGDVNNAGESIDVAAGMQATDNLFFCLSYDIGLTRLRKFNNGSIEATVRWWFNPPEGTKIDTGLGF